jgi:hypothetical protein
MGTRPLTQSCWHAAVVAGRWVRHFALVCHRLPATGRATSPWRAGGGARDESTTKRGERQAGQAAYGQAHLQRIVQARNPFSTLSFRCHIKSSLFFFSPRSLLCRLHAPITQSHTPKSFIALQEPVFCFYTYYLSIWIEENARPVSSILRRRTPST